ncbi:MAG: pirin family protein, partial [Desulfobulbaceae bacterium]|nr:pirin family protein [Desulfobulbaceae bacterium]
LKNIQHGRLRVFNDDVVEPWQGFSMHPHEEMEIISLILSGEMVHKDTIGNEIIVRATEV